MIFTSPKYRKSKPYTIFACSPTYSFFFSLHFAHDTLKKKKRDSLPKIDIQVELES